MVVCVLLGSSNPGDIYVDERSSTEIVFSVDGRIFPKNWYNPVIDATVEPLQPYERDRIIYTLNRAFQKYPNQVLRESLDRVYALKTMRFYGIAFGGTNVRKTVFMCDNTSNPKFTDDYVEGVFHHEFSSILMRSHPANLDLTKWESLNDPVFSYGNGGVNAIRYGEASLKLDPDLFESGFLTRYSQASVEEDINVFAQNLFSGSKTFWSVVDDNPRIRKKANILIKFYQSIDHRFSEYYFRNLPPGSQAGRSALSRRASPGIR